MTLSPSQNLITKKLPFLSPIRAPSELWSTPGTFTRPPANTNTTLITRRFEAPAPLVTWVNTLTAAECHDLPHRRWTDTRQGARDPSCNQRRAQRCGRWRFLTICGSNVAARSLGTSSSTGPVVSVNIVGAGAVADYCPCPCRQRHASHSPGARSSPR